MLSMIPWPGPIVFKISCPRDNARIVRKIIQSKWIPILEKYKVSIPLECPFHPKRDIFGPQQLAKHQHRPSQWTCGFCGKSFFEEKFLDMHFDNRHKSNINMVKNLTDGIVGTWLSDTKIFFMSFTFYLYLSYAKFQSFM